MEEDGEIFEVDGDDNQQSDFSMSSYDGDNGDSLDIKPPQAQIGQGKEKKEKREKRDRHHRHKGESGSSGSSHRHKSDRHRSRSNHRAPGEHHTTEKRRRRDGDRSESGGRRHRERGRQAVPVEGAEHMGGRISSSNKTAGDKESNRSGKREGREHRRGRDRSSSSNNNHQQQQQQHMDHDSGLPDYYISNEDHHHHHAHHQQLPHHHHHGRVPSSSNIPPLLSEPLSHHHQQFGVGHDQHHQQQQHYQQHVGRSRGVSGGAAVDLSLLQLSPRARAEREKRMERMMAAEKQREQSQREVESRRIRKEEKRVGGDPMDYQLQRGININTFIGGAAILPSFNTIDTGTGDGVSNTEGMSPQLQHSPLSADDGADAAVTATSSHHHHRRRQHKKKKHRNKDHPEAAPEVHVISENEEDDELEETDTKKSIEMANVTDADEHKNKEAASEASESGSSESSSDSESDSDSSDSDGEEDGSKNNGEKDGVNGVDDSNNRRSRSGSSTPGREGRFEDSPQGGGGDLSDVSAASGELGRSPTKSPVPMKELLPSYFPAIMGCRSVDEFECLNRIAEGTYGVVYRAREKCNNTIVALKRLKMEKEKEGFPITSLREINTLLKGQHCNIVTVREIVVGSNMDKIYIVMDYVEHDLKSLMETMNKKKQSFSLGEVKTLMLQLLRAVHHLHDNWILHRDLKTSNLLLSHTGILKVGDFGLAREYGSPLKQYTPIVVTLWYRAPELLLGTKLYSTAIDVWSVGCIFGELLAMEPMFPGKSEIDELNRVFKELGTPSESIWPGYSQLPVVKRTQFTEFPYNHLRERFKERLSDKGFHLMNKFLTYDPQKRITCQEALSHDYFHTEPPAPVPPAMFPTWPAKSENPNGVSLTPAEEPNKPPKPPSGGKNFKDLGDDDGFAGFFVGGGQQAGPGFQLKF